MRATDLDISIAEHSSVKSPEAGSTAEDPGVWCIFLDAQSQLLFGIVSVSFGAYLTEWGDNWTLTLARALFARHRDHCISHHHRHCHVLRLDNIGFFCAAAFLYIRECLGLGTSVCFLRELDTFLLRIYSKKAN